MQTIGKKLQRTTSRGTWIALLSLIILGLAASSALAQSVSLSAPVSLYPNGAWPSGVAMDGGVPAGVSWGMNSMGTIVTTTTYTNEVIQFTNTAAAGQPPVYVESNVGPAGNVSAVAISPLDQSLWLSFSYAPYVDKIPMNSDGTYTISSDPSGGISTMCNGTTDTAICELPQLSSAAPFGYWGSVGAMAFDSAGDLFFATLAGENTPADDYSLYECAIGTAGSYSSTSCLYGTSVAPVQLFSEGTTPVSVNGGTGTAQLFIGDIAVDPQGNIFFTDSAIVSAGNQDSAYSDLYEIQNAGGYGVGSQILIATDTVPVANQNSGHQDDEIASIAIVPGAANDNTVYFSATGSGIYAVDDNDGTAGTPYGVANIAPTTGVNPFKMILPDSNGNFYVDANVNGGDTLGFLAIGSATDPTITGVGQTTTFTVNTSDSASGASCSTSGGTLAVTGTNASSFDASATPPVFGTCSNLPVTDSGGNAIGISIPITVTFSPLAVGTDTAVLTATDTTTSASGSANLSAQALKKQVITFGPPASITYASGLTIPLSATGNASGNPFTFTLNSGPATFDSTVANQLDVSAPGTISVTANVAGNTTYAPAPPVTKSIVVDPIPQTINWAPVPPRNVAYSGSDVVVTLAATGGASGQPVVFTVDGSSTATAAVSGTNGSTLTISSTGIVIVDANQAADAAGDYAVATQVQATIDVTAAVLPTGAPVILSQTTFLGALENGAGGGATAASNPDGGTMALDPAGDAIIGTTYGNEILSFNINNTNPGYQTVLAARDTTNNTGVNGVGVVAVDANGNLFAGNNYGGAPFVVKIPWNSTTMSYAPYTATPTANCTGPTSDTAACLMPNIGVVVSGVITGEPLQSMVFDSHGNLFYGVQTDSAGAGTSGIDYEGSIWECDAACLYAGTDQPVMLGEEPTVTTSGGVDSADSAFTSLSPTTKVSQILGGLAVDSVGNLFFTDEAQDASSLIHYSDLYEWPVDTGNASGYATDPITLLTSVPSAPSQYSANPIDGVTIDPTSGNVYFTNDQAIFAFADDLTAPLDPTTVQATMWTVSPQGGKYLVAAPNGVLYVANYSNDSGHDSMYYTTVGSVTVPGSVIDGQAASVPGTAVIGSSTTPVTQMYTVLNDGNCTTPETVTYASLAAEFTAVQGATCNSTITQASSFTTTLTFSPIAPDNGTISGTLTATDSASNTGTATVAGTAQNLIPQTITAFAGITSPVTYGSGPYTLSATGGASGNPVVFSVDSSSSSGVATISGNTLTITGVGTLVIDINQAGNATYQVAPQVQETITVNQASQAITFTTPSSATTSVVYGASPITLAATGGGSGSAVTFSLDASSTAGAGSLSGSTLSFTGVGTIVVDANQAGTANYSAAAQVQVSFTVTQATQTITLTPSANAATYPATVSLTATGGASGSPVVLAITGGSSIATLSGNTLTPTGTAFGEVMVQATQAGTTDYSAAAPQSVTITFNPIGTVATPAFSPATGATLYTNGLPANTVTITDGTADAAITYSLDDAAPANYTGAITLALGSHTITASATETGYLASTLATATYTVSNLPPNFTVSVSPGAVDLTPGSSAIVDITITPNASFLGTVTFSCSGAPSGVTCAFSPSSLTANGVNSLTTVLTITDAATTSANRRGPNPFIPGGATFALALCFLGFRKRRSLILSLVLLAGIFGLTQLTGCGSNAGNSSTGSTTSSMTVTATSAYNGTTITQTLPITITIRK